MTSLLFGKIGKKFNQYKNLVILRLFGGLGNQLFIYSFARYLEIKYNIKATLDIFTGFPKDNFERKIELNNFNVVLNKTSFYNSLFFPARNKVPSLIKYLYPNSIYINEIPGNELDEGIINKPAYNKIFLEGYWQLPKYFEEYKDIIKNELKIISKHKPKNEKLFGEIKLSESVALHFRRIKYQPALPLSYYYDSIKIIEEKVSSPAYYCFSDDIEWCRENIKIDKPIVFIDNNKKDQVEDFWLMTNCKHFIISNSTFAWWAAKLSSYSEKIVLFPEINYWPNKDIFFGL